MAEDPQVYAAISDAFYNARNSGRTMTDAATDATEAVELIFSARLTGIADKLPPFDSDLIRTGDVRAMLGKEGRR